MISADANSALDWLFENAFRDHGLPDPADRCTIRHLAEIPDAQGNSAHRLVVLSIASCVFRIVVLFDFAADEATAAYLARISRSSEPTLQGQALTDACTEFANMICGAVNRGLCTKFRLAGMSTPFVLESSCANHLSILNPEQVRHYQATINNKTRIGFTVCLCINDDTTLDFHIDRVRQPVESSGELELF